MHTDPENSSEPSPKHRLVPSRWLSQIPRDVVLIVVGALLALVSEEVRDARHRRSRVDATIISIRDELRQNASLVTQAREHHKFLADTLGKLVARHARPDVAIYSNGMFNPAIVTSTA